MILLAFDVDGTLDCSAGPVPVVLLDALYAGGAAFVVIVSPSGAYKGDLPRRSDFDRKTNLFMAREAVGAEDLRPEDVMVRLYVSDNKDWDAAHEAGFAYVEAAEFAKGLMAE